MLSGITITCFAASYAVTLTLELSRILFRSGIRGAIMLGFAGAGLLAHTLFLINRAMTASGSPLSSKQDWYLLAAWLLVALYLYLVAYHPHKAFGLFFLPLALALVAVGALVADREPFAREPASRVWGAIHGVSLLLTTVTVLVGFAAGVMYLGQSYRLKRKLPPRPGLRLPSLEWLHRTNRRALVLALVLLAIGIFSGVVLNVIRRGPDSERLPWTDPFVLSTGLMFVWLVASAGLLALYRPAREGPKVAYLTLASFFFLVMALGVGLALKTRHAPLPERVRPEPPVQGTRDGGVGAGSGVRAAVADPSRGPTARGAA